MSLSEKLKCIEEIVKRPRNEAVTPEKRQRIFKDLVPLLILQPRNYIKRTEQATDLAIAEHKRKHKKCQEDKDKIEVEGKGEVEVESQDENSHRKKQKIDDGQRILAKPKGVEEDEDGAMKSRVDKIVLDHIAYTIKQSELLDEDIKKINDQRRSIIKKQSGFYDSYLHGLSFISKLKELNDAPDSVMPKNFEL